MRRTRTYSLAIGAAMMALMGMASGAAAQVTVRAHLFWTWNDGAWRPHRYDWDRRDDRFMLPNVGLWLSAGYMPPPGYCQEWIPGVAPAYQPEPVPCGQLFLPYDYARPGVMIIGSPGYTGPMLDLGFTWGERQRFGRERFERARRAWARERDDHARAREFLRSRAREHNARRDRYERRAHRARVYRAHGYRQAHRDRGDRRDHARPAHRDRGDRRGRGHHGRG